MGEIKTHILFPFTGILNIFKSCNGVRGLVMWSTESAPLIYFALHPTEVIHVFYLQYQPFDLVYNRDSSLQRFMEANAFKCQAEGTDALRFTKSDLFLGMEIRPDMVIIYLR